MLQLILLALGVLIFIYVVYQRLLHPLAGTPGPFAASLSRLWITQLSWRGGTHDVIVALHKQYGKIIRIGPNELSVAEPEAIKKIYGHGTRFRKSDWYSVWQGHRKFDLFPERDEKLHGRQRALVSRPYSLDALRDFEKYVDDAVKVFLERMESLRGKGERRSVDLGMWVQLFAFDVIGEVTFSKRFGFLDNNDAHPAQPKEFQQIETALKSASWLGQMPWVYWIHDALMPYIGNQLGITARHGSLRAFAVRECDNRKDRGSAHQDILGKLLDVHDEKPDQLDMTAVQSMVSSNIFAGSDTTATSMRAVIYYLLRNPQCKQKLVEEIDIVRKEGRGSDLVQLKEAERMPYLQAVLYEALRLHPAVGMSLPRVVPEGGFEVEGQFIPASTVIGTNPWVIHKDKTVFGEDAEDFNPTRWIKRADSAEEDKRVGDMHRCFFSFGAGARMCLGRNLSWMEMSKLVPTLFARYDIELAEPEKEWTMVSWWFVMQKGVNVLLKPR